MTTDFYTYVIREVNNLQIRSQIHLKLHACLARVIYLIIETRTCSSVLLLLTWVIWASRTPESGATEKVFWEQVFRNKYLNKLNQTIYTATSQSNPNCEIFSLKTKLLKTYVRFIDFFFTSIGLYPLYQTIIIICSHWFCYISQNAVWK